MQMAGLVVVVIIYIKVLIIMELQSSFVCSVRDHVTNLRLVLVMHSVLGLFFLPFLPGRLYNQLMMIFIVDLGVVRHVQIITWTFEVQC